MWGGRVVATSANPPLLPKGLECFHVLGLTCYFLLLFIYIFCIKEINKISLYNEISGYSKITCPSQITVSAIFGPFLVNACK